MLDWPTSSPKITRMFGFAPAAAGCWAGAGDCERGERHVASSAAARALRIVILDSSLDNMDSRFGTSFRGRNVYGCWRVLLSSGRQTPDPARRHQIAGRIELGS